MRENNEDGEDERYKYRTTTLEPPSPCSRREEGSKNMDDRKDTNKAEELMLRRRGKPRPSKKTMKTVTSA
jgi:hypothetical protein